MSDAPAAAPERPPGVHRLVDMLVEEVSLVDRPANKQRFLVVKRSEMPKKTPEQTPAATEDEPKPKGKKPKAPFPKAKAKKPAPPAPAKDPADADEEEDEEEEDPDEAEKALPPKEKDPDEEEEGDPDEEPADAPAAEDKPRGRKPPKKRARKDEPSEEEFEPQAGDPDDEANDDDETPLGIALAALDSLTQAVEILSDSPDDGSPLASVAQDIRDAADAITAAAGIEPDNDENEEPPGEASIAGLVSSIQEMLGRIDSLTQALSASVQTPATTPTITTETQAPPDFAGTLAEVAQSMKSLNATLKAQAARISTLEKRAGVPNSAPAGERVAKAEPEETSWPLDLNRPLDRSSVERTVSFHDAD
ncbi:MAG: hypothetical protein ACLQVI_30640 [Polyangiaceae bacterium]